ncbi:MAG: ABC transporter ATP-binding protein [Acidobacteriota bacterium]
MELIIRNLSKTYSNGVKALSNVFLTIPKGMFGLLGPNGAGKSTLMRTIATLQEADTGSIELDGIDVLKNKEVVRRQLGYLPQEFGVYPKMSAEAMLDHIAVLKGVINGRERREIVKALLHQTNLYEVRKKNLGSFSGGMRQRFGIAQALLGSPKLIIVDEPTAGLDPAERNRFLNLLSEIGENIVVILSTHIVDDVKEICKQMAIISRGEVLQQGNPLLAINALQGKIWKKVISKQELAHYSANFSVISSKLVAGNTEIHVYSDIQPDSTFTSVEAELGDVYFSAIAGKGRTTDIQQPAVA